MIDDAPEADVETERELVLKLARGDLPSPQRFCRNLWAVVTLLEANAVHVRDDGELAYRDSADWITPTMCERLIGLPVCDTAPFAPTHVIGFVVHAFRDGNRLRAVARILPPEKVARSGQSFAGQPESANLHVLDGDGDLVMLDAIGGRIVIEHEPRFVSHITIT
jgi:hypothetical protein